MKNIEDNYVSLKEAADYLQFHYMTMNRWANEGKIKVIKVGGSWKIKRSWLDDILRNGVKWTC